MGKPQSNSPALALFSATFCYVGYLPFIPGTFGSLAGIFVYYAVKSSVAFYLAVTLIITIVGFFISTEAEKALDKKDPGCIVIDEVSGMLISLLFIPYDFRLVVAGFFIFRLLDTLKPYPACVLQKIKGGVGVMSDDIIAGIYTNLVLQLVLRLASWRIS